jgi:hypothetical protein
MADRSHAAEVIADRYLTSPSRLAARPFGPIDALDTHSGRAAQVRIVFASGEWQESELADAVARWCAIGVTGVCGVLDFGRHGDRWFLVLPPSLGTPVERWRSMRQPSAVDAAALALSFGRLLEAVAAAGFDAGSAVVADFAVGPGPTPFLEQPLLTSPGAAAALTRRAGGQQVLAALFTAAVAERDLPPDLSSWRQAAADAAHPSLGVCLDALERAASTGSADRADARPLGLDGVFDAPYVARDRRPWMAWTRRAVGPLAVALALACAIGLTVFGNGGRSQTAAPATPRPKPAAAHHSRPVVTSPAPTVPTAPAPLKHRVKHHRRARHPHHTPAAHAPRPTPVSPPATVTRPTATAPPSSVTLPAPGGTVLPSP